ncbi:PREDICTED: MADS-box transcription factor 17-like [Lupinus angustifolius]|uniref:MADS-box transcription factor 17-like n=1 Tax=Lupinus angustifolius TaxID=3871 RepID=UPI00092F1495|nr:PREDICTED: MADS-box transcription factor 17-like [Lupinus angustifolius]
MGRGRVIVERIENKISRQVTFSKRRSGLLKKAFELSVLCDAEIALIIFSSRGKLFQFSTSDINKIIEKYRQCCFNMSQTEDFFEHQSSQNLYEELLKLRAKHESLEKTQRNFEGEDLGPLSMKELQSLEKQIDRTLSQARQHHMQKLLARIDELRQQVQNLEGVNKQLEAKERDKVTHTIGEGSNNSTTSVCSYNHIRLHESGTTLQPCWFGNHEQGGSKVSTRSELGQSSHNNNNGWLL